MTDYVDAEPVRQHVLRLQQAGFTSNRIADLAGLTSFWIAQTFLTSYNRRSRKYRTRADIAARILAIDPTRDLPGMVDATGTRRRVQALVAAGWPMAHVCKQAGVSAQNMATILARPRLRSVTVAAFSNAYDELAHAKPARCGVAKQATVRSCNRARANRWPPPAYWAQFPGAIDDPHFIPEYGRPKGELIAEEARFLLSGGTAKDDVARRLGVSQAYLAQVLRLAA